MRSPCRHHARLSRLLLLVLAAAAATGCVRRRLLVRSNPPGATVHVDNQPIGVTPCGVDFVYYGTREIRLSKPGYETLTVNQPIPTPWYDLPGVDFFSENLIPTTIKDERAVSYNLVRQRMAPAEEIIARGEELRRPGDAAGGRPAGSLYTGAVRGAGQRATSDTLPRRVRRAADTRSNPFARAAGVSAG